MRIACFSDTHNKHKAITLPECDIAIFAGDLSSVGHKHEVDSFLRWFNKQTQCTHRVFVAGNHDKSFDKRFFHKYEDHDLFETNYDKGKPGWLLEMLEQAKVIYNTHYLENNYVTVEGLKIWGSPITPSFYREYWAFNADRGSEIQQYWDTIPTDADIVVTHGPVYGKLDYVPESGEYVGCVDLKKKMEEVKPVLFVSGHIHSGRGAILTPNTNYVNASILNNRYEKEAEAYLFELDVDNYSLKYISG